MPSHEKRVIQGYVYEFELIDECMWFVGCQALGFSGVFPAATLEEVIETAKKGFELLDRWQLKERSPSSGD